MDDSLERPTALPSRDPSEDLTEEEEEPEGEDVGLDWGKLQVARPVIPKRGEKEFEPKPGGGSGLQIHVLDRSRTAMFDALRTNRTVSSKAISHAVWCSNIGRAYVTLAKGIHFSSIGHSAPRSGLDENGTEKLQKRLELLPEEAIYLVERGSLFCWKEVDVDLSAAGVGALGGVPMTVQEVHSEMIGFEDITLERYQVYAYLKRLGYSVIRTHPPTPYYPTPPPRKEAVKTTAIPSIFQRILSLFPLWTSKVGQFFIRDFDWWRPVQISRWLHHDKNYAFLYRSLRLMSAGHNIPLFHSDLQKRQKAKSSSPYQIFYNIYKPNTPFKKSTPPYPDYQIVVINGRTTPMPTLQELTDLFTELPELPPPLPRQRRSVPSSSTPPGGQISATAAVPLLAQPLIGLLFPWAFRRLPAAPVRRPHPFMALKAGKKIIVIAVVDSGSISFFRFGQGAFNEWPMI